MKPLWSRFKDLTALFDPLRASGLWIRAKDAAARLNVSRRRAGLGIPAGLHRRTTRALALMTVTFFVLIGVLVWSLSYVAPRPVGVHLSYTELLKAAQSGLVQKATIDDVQHEVYGTAWTSLPPKADGTASGVSLQGLAPNRTTSYWANIPASDVVTPILADRLQGDGVAVDFAHPVQKAIVLFVAQFILPVVILANLFGIVFIGIRTGGGDAISGVVQFGRLGKRQAGRQAAQRITFADVGGADEAVTELREVRDYLADPARFTAMGAQPPKGVLMVGPPGCGKTLLARAVAGEADVPFFSISGAEFVESLVGVGAARVRDLFRQVRQSAPAIVFIDEVDAAGRRRGGVTGGQEEREQTLNQLLVEMDGFDPTAGIVVMAATNRPDILDPALLRPGRFDRQVTVEPPDLEGRRSILELHARNRPLTAEVDLETVARRTPGFTGADLANVINEAALLAVRFGKAAIGPEEMDEAVQRVMTGPRRRGHLLSQKERRRAAIHEAGHVVVAAAMGRMEHIQRVSIVARGRTLGEAAASRSLAERELLTRSELQAELLCSMAGVAAEELALGEPSTGGEADLERANALAHLIAGRYGMSQRLGKVQFLRREGGDYLGGTMVPTDVATGPVLMEMHQEVRRLLDEAEAGAGEILGRHRKTLTEISKQLVEVESLDGPELEEMLEPVRPEINLAVADLAFEDADGHSGSNGSTVAAGRHDKRRR